MVWVNEGENDSLMKYSMWMDALARLAKSCLLWHYVSFLRLFFFKGKEKLKSPLRIEDECIWHKGGRESLRLSEVSWEGNRTGVGSQKTVSCASPASLGGLPELASPSPPPSHFQHPHPGQLFTGPHTNCRVSWRSYFGWGLWLVYLCAPLNAAGLRETGSETCGRHNERGN